MLESKKNSFRPRRRTGDAIRNVGKLIFRRMWLWFVCFGCWSSTPCHDSFLKSLSLYQWELVGKRGRRRMK
jgi:hypothetical protein